MVVRGSSLSPNVVSSRSSEWLGASGAPEHQIPSDLRLRVGPRLAGTVVPCYGEDDAEHPPDSFFSLPGLARTACRSRWRGHQNRGHRRHSLDCAGQRNGVRPRANPSFRCRFCCPGGGRYIDVAFGWQVPVYFTNPFDATEVFEFPPGTSQSQAHSAVAELLLARARERLGYVPPVTHMVAAVSSESAQ